jgi:hypothetical protein
MKLEADLLSEPGIPLSGGDAFSCFLAVIGRMPKQARAEALGRLEVARAGPDLIGRLTVCLGLEPAAKEVRIDGSGARPPPPSCRWG